jgi:hypothetical protein
MVWDNEDITKLIELYHSGLSDEDMSVVFGVSEHCIKYQRRVYKLVNRKKCTCGINIDKFCELYEMGFSDGKLADEFNLSIYYVKQIRKELGFTSQITRHKHEIECSHEKMLELYYKNYTDVAIGNEVGIKACVVYRWRVSNNLSTRNEHYRRMVEARHLNNALVEQLDKSPISDKFADNESLYNNIEFLERLLERKLKD